MKRIAVILAALALLGGQAFAQIVPGAGYIHSTLTTNSGGSTDNDSKSGFYAGASVNFEIPAVKGLGFVPGVYLSLITSTKQDSQSASVFGITFTQSGKAVFNELALNVPTLLKYSIDLSGAKLFAYAGPTFQLGIISRLDVEASGIISGSSNLDYYADDSGYNRFNVLVGGGIGFQLSRVIVNLGYDYGITNVYRGLSNVSGNRSNLHLGIGYAF